MARAVITQGELPVAGDPVFLDRESARRAGTVINVVGLPGGGGELLVTVPPESSAGAVFPIDPEGRTIQLAEFPAKVWDREH